MDINKDQIKTSIIRAFMYRGGIQLAPGWWEVHGCEVIPDVDYKNIDIYIDKVKVWPLNIRNGHYFTHITLNIEDLQKDKYGQYCMPYAWDNWFMKTTIDELNVRQKATCSILNSVYTNVIEPYIKYKQIVEFPFAAIVDDYCAIYSPSSMFYKDTINGMREDFISRNPLINDLIMVGEKTVIVYFQKAK